MMVAVERINRVWACVGTQKQGSHCQMEVQGVTSHLLQSPHEAGMGMSWKGAQQDKHGKGGVPPRAACPEVGCCCGNGCQLWSLWQGLTVPAGDDVGTRG